MLACTPQTSPVNRIAGHLCTSSPPAFIQENRRHEREDIRTSCDCCLDASRQQRPRLPSLAPAPAHVLSVELPLKMIEPLIIETATLVDHDFITINLDDDIQSSPVYILNSSTNSPRHSLDHLDSDRLQEEDALQNQHSFLRDLTATNKVEPPHLHSARITLNCIHPTTLQFATRKHNRQRSLTDASCCSSNDDEMTAFATEAPGSPPGLSGSKSSKSSSYHSSSLSGADGILSDITHFEDIGLDEDSQPFQPVLHGMDKISRPPPRTSATTSSGHRSNAAAMTTIRELTSAGHRPPHPRMPKGHTPTHSLSLPNQGFMRRGYRNASTPSLAITAMSNYNRSRSPSPNPASPMHRPLPSPKSPRRVGLAPLTNHPPKRRTSWQPSRKSIKELEAEYTENDEDDELPDDASLWNVPLSPRPPTERMSRSANPSPKASPCGSPERPSPLRASHSAHASNPPKTAPALSRNPTSPEFGFPTSPRDKKLVRGASTGAVPDHFGFPTNGRAKSWNVVLSELSEDAKALTETLETHAMESERKHEEAVQNGLAINEPAIEKLSRSKTSTIELPPLRLNNVMIDPLPISKEKEKVLTRTRPSWLPPKSQKEEKKHLKEYQRMMEKSREAEKRRAVKMADSQCAKDDTKNALLRIWEEHVLPNWDQVIREPRTRELWWRGVAPKSRGQVWQRAIGNDLALTETTFTKALYRAKEIEASISRNGSSSSEIYQKEKAWFAAIRRDVKVTFPDLNIFQPGGPLHDNLVDVLLAYSMYRSDVGYSHGTHLTAAFLLLTLPTPATTFLTLSNLLNRPLPLAFLTGDPAATQKAYSLTLTLLSVKYPRLHAHLFGPAMTTTAPSPDNNSSSSTPTSTCDSFNLPPHLVLEPMMRTLFLGPAGGVGLDTAARVWDVMVFDGDTAIIRTAVAALGALEGKLYGDRASVLAVLGWSGGGWGVSGEEEFIARVRGVGKEGAVR